MPFGNLNKSLLNSLLDEFPFANDPRGVLCGDVPGDRTEWLRALNFIRESHHKRFRKKAANLIPRFEVTKFRDAGMVLLECCIRAQTFEVSIGIDFEDHEFEVECSCGNTDHYGQCEHTLLGVRFVISKLEDLQSDLAKTLADSHNELRTRMAFSELDRFLRQSTSAEDNVGLGEPQQQDRIIWRVETSPLSLTPVLQRPKKRGNGWTKGTKLSLEKFKAAAMSSRSSLDRKIAELVVTVRSSYYREDYSLGVSAALELLAGSDLVFLNDEPATVESKPFGVRVNDLGNQFTMVVDAGVSDHERKMFVDKSGVVIVDEVEQNLEVRRAKKVEVDLATYLLNSSPSFPVEKVDDLKQRIEHLQDVTNLILPESLSGASETYEAPIAVLLRADEAGNLDLGIRTRHADKRFALPGDGLLHCQITRDDKPVRMIRRPDTELPRATNIRGMLQLDPADVVSPWTWHIDGFDAVLQFLGRLESAGGIEPTDTDDISDQSDGSDAASADTDDVPFHIVWDEASAKKMSYMGAIAPQNLRVEVAKKRDWFGIKGDVKIGDHEVNLQQLLASLGGGGRFVEVSPGKWASITAKLREKLERLREVAHTNRKQLEFDATAAEVVRDLSQADIEFKATRAWQTCLTRLDRSKELEPEVSPEFNADLREYQLDGYRWMRRLAEWGVGGCLADDMGLGKTVQTLAVLVDRSEIGPALVIAPTSVGFNWQSETERFAPSLKPHLYRDTARGEFIDDAGPGDVVICSYGLALRDAEHLAKVKWGTLVLDEAQFIKNSRSKTAQAIFNIDADWKLALTGTPMENHLGELWSLFHAISPGLFGGWDHFRKRFATPIEKHGDEKTREALARVLQPFLLRRKKSEVLTELPERTEINLYVDLSEEERQRYDTMRLAAFQELGEIAGLPDTKDQRFRVLAILTRLRQLSCHPRLLDENWTESSAKLSMLVETVERLKEEGHRALVFSQFTSHLGLIREALDNAGVTYQYLDGQTPANARKQRVEKFQSGEGDVFLISLKAGGTGLNLTAADYVIHMDPWWNPAVEDQATDRTHRIGQTKPVIVYRIIARDTIEEQILSLHTDKRDLVSNVLDGTQSAGKLSTDELASLIRSEAANVRGSKQT